MQPKSFLIVAALLIFSFVTGFDTRNAVVPEQEILAGGPPKDGIPALLEPRFVAAEAAAYLKPEDQVIGIVVGNQARAYPINILNWHEAVNDMVGDQPLVVTF